jgi:HSP20 family protein
MAQGAARAQAYRELKLSTPSRRSLQRRIDMSLVRWDPFGDFDTFFNRMMPRTFASWPRIGLGDGGEAKFEWSPSADISETEKEYLVRAELPAVKKEDVKVTIDNGMLKIEGERKQKKEEKNEKFHRVESFYGTFTRQFALPDNIEANSIRCESQDGVLTVHLPKKTVEKPKQIEIKVQ